MIRLIALFLLSATVAFAQPNPAQLSLLPGWRTDDGTVMAGLRITLDRGWKTYWRAPGEAGIPPYFDWSGSENLDQVTIHWPNPKVFHSAGMRIIAYSGDVVIPIELTPKHPGPIQLDLNLDMGICRDICMPMTYRFQADLGPGTRRNPQIIAALLDQPRAGSGLACTLTPTDSGLRLTVEANHPPADLVIETPDAEWVSEPVVEASPTGLIAHATLGSPALAIDRSQIRVTLIPPSGPSLDFRGCN